ncbi:MAG: peptidoglycan DD-metalloendopeptidase family protein [Deltaproteobacteria bacterium]|nr:peptidoglycan DD-metalloendopeptidase family protein [Deltaproteobacteria bacterium]MDL1961009.1 peptidoglycan DD-metalloendopeptidase family protein [Deltaproteobacteria bacterium]
MIKRNRLWLIALIILSIHAYAFGEEDLVKKELEVQQQRLKSLQKEIATHQEKASDIELSKRSLLKELTELDEKIAQQWESLQKTRQEWTIKELTLIEIQKDYAGQKQALQSLKFQVEHRLRALREMGEVGSLNILFAAETLTELLSRETYFRLILDHDREQRSLYRLCIKKLDENETELEQQRKTLKAAADKIETQILLFEERKQEKQAFLDELKQQGELYEMMLKELESAEQSLQDIIKCLGSKSAKLLISGPVSPDMYDFRLQKGKLNPPVVGQLFRTGAIGWRNDRECPGVIFSIPRGSEIRAIFDGTVEYNDIVLGYGKVLIIDHGNHYFSMVSQGAQFFKTVGQKVTEGEIIGLTGGGPWVQEGIYFEIRHGERQEDPLEWFDPRAIKACRSK